MSDEQKQESTAEAPKAETTAEENKSTSVDSGLEFEKVKRYVDSSIAKMLDDIIKKDQEKMAKELDSKKEDEKKGLEKW